MSLLIYNSIILFSKRWKKTCFLKRENANKWNYRKIKKEGRKNSQTDQRSNFNSNFFQEYAWTNHDCHDKKIYPDNVHVQNSSKRSNPSRSDID